MLAHGLLGLGLLSAVLAQKTHHITVGGSNGQTFFTPHFVKANPQDTITFWFNPKNHTVTQSSFDSPCLPLAGGIDTGFRPVTIGTAAHERPTFNFTVTDANPSWFYCRQGEGTENSHCGAGMVFAINPGDRHSDNSFRKFRKNAEYQGEALATAPAPAWSAPAATASVGPDQLDTLTALDTDNSTSGGGLGSYGPAIVGLLAGILLALVGLLAVGVIMYIRRGARPGRSIKRNSTYAPVHGHTAPMMMDDGYHEESLSSSTPLKYSEQGL